MKRIILPHEKHGHRAHAVSHSALLGYSLLLLIFVVTFRILLHQTGAVLGFATNIYLEDVYSLTNKEREKNNLSALNLNEELSAAAQKKAEDMFKDNYWAHIAPGGTTPWEFIEESGYDYYFAGENLARDFDDTSSVIRAWMNSPTHRDNVLGENYQDIGIAVVNGVLKGHETTLVVQLFGGRQTSRIGSQPSGATPVTVEKREETVGLSRPGGIPQASLPVLTAAETPVVSGAGLSSYVKTSVIVFALFLVSLFGLDLIVVSKKSIMRVSGSTLAHIALLLFLIFVAWWANVGVIL